MNLYEHDSIFGNTRCGVPNPLVPHWHPYPTRYHGPWFGTISQNEATYRERPYQRTIPLNGLGGCGCLCGFGQEEAEIEFVGCDVSVLPDGSFVGNDGRSMTVGQIADKCRDTGVRLHPQTLSEETVTAASLRLQQAGVAVSVQGEGGEWQPHTVLVPVNTTQSSSATAASTAKVGLGVAILIGGGLAAAFLLLKRKR